MYRTIVNQSKGRRSSHCKRLQLLLACWILFLGLYPLFVSAAADAGKPELRIGVVYRAGDTGNRILSGVNSALESYLNQKDSKRKKFKVVIEKYPYIDEHAGIDRIYSIFDNKDKKNLHLILGPSDSGVFVEMAKRPEYENKASLPVISPLVTSQEGNNEGDWRFRINVDTEVRSHAISDYLNRIGYQAVGVLYRDNEFGKHAAETFKSQLSQTDENNLALPYSNELQLREQVQKIIQQRPAAVGVFGRRHDVKFVQRAIKALDNGWFGYRPLIFSIYDTRTLILADTHFVSLVAPNQSASLEKAAKVWDEVKGLAHDTTLLVLRIAGRVPGNPSRGEWAESFRKRLFTHMLGPPQADPMFITGMEFSDGKNLSPPMVLNLSSESKEQRAEEGHPWQALWKLGDWIEIRQRRFGNAIWFNLSLVVIIAIWLTLSDIRRRQTIRSRSIYLSRPVFALTLFNVVCATATLIVVAETEVIRWDNVLAALGVAVGYRAMLTTTIFETAQGQALGFGRLYERTLASINKRITSALHKQQSAAINYVTYTNSLPNMRDLLVDIYSFAQDREDSRSQIEELDAEIKDAKGALKKQEVCARRLLQAMSWKQLQENRIIPSYIKEKEIIDPNVILRDSLKYVMRTDENYIDTIKPYIDKALHQLQEDSPKNHEQALKDLEADLDNSEIERGRLYCRLRWLYTQWGFSLRRIKNVGLLPDDYGKAKEGLGPLQQDDENPLDKSEEEMTKVTRFPSL